MADAKIECYNADGSLQFNLDNRILRVLGTITTGTTDGSQTIAGVDQGEVIAVGRTAPDGGVTATVTKSGSGVAWTFNGAPANQRKNITYDVMVY